MTTLSARYWLPEVTHGWFDIAEVDDAGAAAGELFRRSFRGAPPDFPRHYVARVALDGTSRTIGYVHMTPTDGIYLCGGMCMDERVYRRLAAGRRATLKAIGGIAEQMLRYVFADCSDGRAIFGYVGDRRAERVDLRAGFRHTGYKHLIVYWPRPLPESEQRTLIEKAAAIGPF